MRMIFPDWADRGGWIQDAEDFLSMAGILLKGVVRDACLSGRFLHQT